MRVCAVFLLVIAACGASTDKVLDDITWGKEVDGDFIDVLDRARFALRKEFPKGLDPDRTDEGAGDLWTVWHHYKSTWSRKTLRKRAHVQIEQLDDGKCRIGVSVVQQKNKNVENPSILSEAKWVATSRDQETAARVEKRIAKRYLNEFKPSKAWEEKHRKEKSKGMREDIIDRNRDVDLNEEDRAGDRGSLPSITSKDPYWDSEKKKKKDDD